jgi:hypothetical protein
MRKPLIQIDDIGTSREMTDEEYAALLATSWSQEAVDATTTTDS